MTKKNDVWWKGSTAYYCEELTKAASKKETKSYQFGNCKFDCTCVEHDSWNIHAHDTDGNDRTFERMTTIQAAGMMHNLYNSFGDSEEKN